MAHRDTPNNLHMATYLSVKTYTFYIYYVCIIICQHNVNISTLWYS
jgi:hypothetical protein